MSGGHALLESGLKAMPPRKKQMAVDALRHPLNPDYGLPSLFLIRSARALPLTDLRRRASFLSGKKVPDPYEIRRSFFSHPVYYMDPGFLLSRILYSTVRPGIYDSEPWIAIINMQ